jgi:hypothetical protein
MGAVTAAYTRRRPEETTLDAPELCRSTEQISAPSMNDARIRSFDGVRSSYRENFYREGVIDGGQSMTLSLRSGVSSSNTQPYVASEQVALNSFIVILK